MNRRAWKNWTTYVGTLKDDLTESARLKLLNDLYKELGGYDRRYLKERQLWHRAPLELGEDGLISIVWSGRDCDCVAYEDVVYEIDANWQAIQEHVRGTYEWADGPCYYYLEKPSIAKELRRSSRDLALEAFENGHPHYITY